MIQCRACGAQLFSRDEDHECLGWQRALTFGDPRVAVFKTKLEIEFDKFHGNNPHIYELFKKYVLQVIERGFQHYSARTIIHRIRWHTSVDTTDPEGFKINNNHSPYYARMFLARFPQHAGFFRNRKVSGED